MPILSRDNLPHHKPYVRLADCPARLDIPEGSWPDEPALYQELVFFEWADDLLETYCTLTHSHLPFDLYEFTQLDRPWQIRALAADLLSWASQLARCPEHYFKAELGIYNKSPLFPTQDSASPEDLRRDLIETLLFIVGKLNEMASSRRCLIIEGI